MEIDMNPVLAQIYGTGFEKQASDEDLDLDQISGADLLAILAEAEMGKEASDENTGEAAGDIDLSQLSGTELLGLLSDVDGEPNTIEKMANDGSFDYFDMAGRIQAHAYADEMNKLAADEDDEDIIEVNLDEIDGATLVALMDEGYEFDMDKEAGVSLRSNVLALPGIRHAVKGERAVSLQVGKWLTNLPSLNRRALLAGGESAANARLAIMRKMRKTGVPSGPAKGSKKYSDIAAFFKTNADSPILDAQYRAAGMGADRKTRQYGRRALGAAALGAAGTAAAGTAAAGTAAAGTAAAMYMKKKKGPWSKGGRFNK